MTVKITWCSLWKTNWRQIGVQKAQKLHSTSCDLKACSRWGNASRVRSLSPFFAPINSCPCSAEAVHSDIRSGSVFISCSLLFSATKLLDYSWLKCHTSDCSTDKAIHDKELFTKNLKCTLWARKLTGSQPFKKAETKTNVVRLLNQYFLATA